MGEVLKSQHEVEQELLKALSEAVVDKSDKGIQLVQAYSQALQRLLSVRT